jgi:hypothetical protein
VRRRPRVLARISAQPAVVGGSGATCPATDVDGVTSAVADRIALPRVLPSPLTLREASAHRRCVEWTTCVDGPALWRTWTGSQRLSSTTAPSTSVTDADRGDAVAVGGAVEPWCPARFRRHSPSASVATRRGRVGATPPTRLRLRRARGQAVAGATPLALRETAAHRCCVEWTTYVDGRALRRASARSQRLSGVPAPRARRRTWTKLLRPSLTESRCRVVLPGGVAGRRCICR